jgi:hypothetical protein
VKFDGLSVVQTVMSVASGDRYIAESIQHGVQVISEKVVVPGGWLTITLVDQFEQQISVLTDSGFRSPQLAALFECHVC